MEVVALHNNRVAGVHGRLVKDTDGLGDGLRGEGVVFGHHEDLDANALADVNGLADAFAEGVDEGEETDEGHVGGEAFGEVFPWGGKAVGKAEHALAEPAEVRVRLDELVLELVAVDDLVRGTLEHEHEGVRGARLLVDGLLPLVGGVEL
eukprot:9094739-Pyramimonas_sp.AAC.1